MTKQSDTPDRPMSANAMLAEYANLATTHDALNALVAHKVIDHDDRIRLARKFMDDRPAFKAVVQAAIDAGIR